MYCRRSEEITERAEIHTITEEAEILLYVTIFIHVLPQKAKKLLNVPKFIQLQKKQRYYFMCLYSYMYCRRSEEITKRAKIHTITEETKDNIIESLDVPMFYIRIVQVRRRSITTPKRQP